MKMRIKKKKKKRRKWRKRINITMNGIIGPVTAQNWIILTYSGPNGYYRARKFMCLCNGIDFTWRFNLVKWLLFATVGFQRNTCENLQPILSLSAKIGLRIWTVTQSLHTIVWLVDRFISHALFKSLQAQLDCHCKQLYPAQVTFPRLYSWHIKYQSLCVFFYCHLNLSFLYFLFFFSFSLTLFTILKIYNT